MKRLAIFLGLLAGPAAAGCSDVSFEGQSFTACEVDPRVEELRRWLHDEAGRPWGGFDRLDTALGAEGAALGVAMNGGMYHPDRRPVGLYIEDGREIAPIVTREGPGNFGLLPNGVLCIAGAKIRVVESRRFAEERPACDYATQSGPMLVIGGELHPRFLPDSTSRNVRNGVGVRADGTAVLAISNEPVTFDTFGRFFRDAMDTPDALYLDGSVSRLHAPAIGRSDFGLPVGPILGTVARD